MKQQTFLKGAIILTLAGFLNRIMGFLLRIVMVQYLGDEGVGLYSMVYPIYVTLILLCTAGFPVAVAKIVSEKNAQRDVHGALRVLRIAFATVLCTSICITTIVFFSSRWISLNLLSDLRTHKLLMVIAPSLIFVSIASVLRSYFQGLRTMTPTALSQTIEQIVRISASIFLITLLAPRGLVFGATGAALGITTGELAGMLTLIFLFINQRVFNKSNQLLTLDPAKAPPTRYSRRQAFHDLCKMGLPITIGKIVISLMYSLDAILIPSRLQLAGLSVAEATSQFGQLTGIALQIIFLPTIISTALTTSLVPSISDAIARNNFSSVREKYHEVLRFTFYIGLPATLFFFFRGQQICHLLFNFPEAGTLLALLSFGAISTYFIHVAGGVLNGLGKPHLAVKNMVLGACFKLGCLLSLVSHPLFGIKGAAISIAAGWIVSSIADFISIGRIIGFSFNIRHIIIKPLIGCVLLYLALPLFDGMGTSLGLTPRFITLLTIFISGLSYILWMILVKGLSREDLQKFR